MKRMFITLLLLVAYRIPVEAQLIRHWGVMGGVTSSTHVIDRFDHLRDDTRRRTGVHAGVYAEWFNLRYFSAVTQLVYAQKGAGLRSLVNDYEHPLGTGETVTSHARLDYLSLAVVAKAAWPFTTLSPYIEAGPRLDILLGHHGEDARSFSGWYDHFRHTVFGFSFGAGVQTDKLLPLHVFIESRYNIDLANSFAVHTNFSDYSINNSSFDVSVGFGMK